MLDCAKVELLQVKGLTILVSSDIKRHFRLVLINVHLCTSDTPIKIIMFFYISMLIELKQV